MADPKKPAVFRLDPEPDQAVDAAPAADAPAEPRPRKAGKAVVVQETPDAFATESAPIERAEDPELKGRGGLSWLARAFWSALTGLVSLAVGLWFWRLVEDLYRTNIYVGWVGVALLAVMLVALTALVVREARGLMRLAAVTELREAAEKAVAADDGPAAKAVVLRLMSHQAHDPATAAGRARMQGLMGEIIDGRGLLTLADRTLLAPRDDLARAAIASAAKRVSVVTAISPRAIVDIMFVAAQSVMLTRRIADIYGARPGTLGFLRLGRRILGHLAITGGVALSDSVLSQLVGHGMAARLSAKLGEGVLNGLLTARVGLAALAACRPLPFLAGEEPKLQDVAGDIVSNPLGRDG
jgi:putative membrane protein